VFRDFQNALQKYVCRLELYRYHFLPIMPIPRIADYWKRRYRLWNQLFRNLFIQNVRFRSTEL